MKLFKALFMVCIFALSISSCGNSSNTEQDRVADENGNYVKLGEDVPEFDINYLSGDIAKISTLKGKVVLVNFWATWCPYCVAEFKVLKEGIVDRYADNEDFVAILINRGEQKDVIEEWMEKNGYSLNNPKEFPAVAMDVDSSVFHLFADKGIPRNYVIDRDGKLTHLGLDYTPEEFEKLQQAIDQTLGKE